MNIQQLFNCLDDYEKSLMLDLCRQWQYNKDKDYKELLNRNSQVLYDWSGEKITNKLKNVMSEYFTSIKMELDFVALNEFDLYELKRVRNVGSVAIKEYLSYKKQ